MNYHHSSLGPDLASHAVPQQQYYASAGAGFDTRKPMPIVNDPCGLFGPLAPGSNWPYEVLIYPAAARPAYGQTFNLYRELVVGVTDVFVDVVSIELGSSEEGRILHLAGEEEGAIGSDLFWRFVVDESSPGRYDVMRGGWSSISNPAQIITPIPSHTKAALQVFLPAAGGAPRTVRGLLRGWVAPFDGGGTFAGGFGRS